MLSTTLPLLLYVLGQTDLGKQCRPRSDCSSRSSLIWVYTVCHSTRIFRGNICITKANFSILSTITAIILGVPIFIIFMVLVRQLKLNFITCSLMRYKYNLTTGLSREEENTAEHLTKLQEEKCIILYLQTRLNPLQTACTEANLSL